MFLRLALGWRHQVGPGCAMKPAGERPRWRRRLESPRDTARARPLVMSYACISVTGAEKLLNESASGLGLGRTYGVPPI